MLSNSVDESLHNVAGTIAKWATDPVLVNALTTSDNEMCTDFRVISHLFSSGSIRLEQTEKELNLALQEAVKASAKSKSISDEHIVEADRCWLKGSYQDAYAHYVEAIRFMPLSTTEDYSRLATIYFRRMRLTLEESTFEDIVSAVKDIELASMACTDTVKLLLNEDDVAMQDYIYQKRDGKPLIEPNDPDEFGIHPDVQVTTKLDEQGKSRLVLLSGQHISAGTVLVTEKAFSWFSSNTLNVCAYCDLNVEDSRFWPCSYCADSIYCSRQCEEMHFEVHKYECGLTAFLKKWPLFMVMLRFYFRCNRSPMSACPEKVDHVGLYLDSVRNGLPVEPYVLNAFRQSMDQHERRHILKRDLRQYFGCLLESIEFVHLYDACLFNADRLDALRVMLKDSGHGGEQELKQAEQASASVVRDQRKKFSWASTEWKASKAEMITCVFRDLKRFIASPLTKFILPFSKSVKPDNDLRDRQLLVLTGILFPAFIGNRSAAADGEIATENVVPQFNDVMQMVAATDIAPGHQLATRVYNTKFY